MEHSRARAPRVELCYSIYGAGRSERGAGAASSSSAHEPPQLLPPRHERCACARSSAPGGAGGAGGDCAAGACSSSSSSSAAVCSCCGSAVTAEEDSPRCALGSVEAQTAAVRRYDAASNDELLQAARAGSVAAAFVYGQALLLGNRGMQVHFARGAHWLQGASDAHLVMAQCVWSGIVRAGSLAVPGDAEAATRLLVLAVNSGFVRAHWLLGLCYQRGSGVRVNHVQAVRQFRIAAEAGCGEAMAEIANCYVSRGGSLEQDHALAREWALKAVDRGDGEGGDSYGVAEATLGLLHLKGQGGANRSPQLALQHFAAAARRGNAYGARCVCALAHRGLSGAAEVFAELPAERRARAEADVLRTS